MRHRTITTALLIAFFTTTSIPSLAWDPNIDPYVDSVTGQPRTPRVDHIPNRGGAPMPSGWGTKDSNSAIRKHSKFRRGSSRSTGSYYRDAKKLNERRRNRSQQRRRKKSDRKRAKMMKRRAADDAKRRQQHAAYLREEQDMMAGVQRARKAGNYAQVVNLLKKMNAQGHPNGAYVLGNMYLKGDGVKADQKKAFTWFYTAARGGSGNASYALAQAYLNGDGIKQDKKQAVDWLRVSNAPVAKKLLGAMYLDGIGVEKNYSAAWDCFRKSSDPFAQAALGEICYLGLGMQKRPLEAKKWFAPAARAGNPKALFYLSKMYASGDGVEKDSVRASKYAELYEKACSKLIKPQGPEQELLARGFDDMESRMARLKKDSTKSAPGRATKIQTVQKATSQRVAQKQQENRKATSPAKSKDEVYKEVELLVKKFYPRAKIASTEKTLHFEFKAKDSKSQGNKIVRIPKLDGIVGDITPTAGRYPGKEYLPSQTNGTLYVSLLMAPYSASDDNHLLTRLRFPPNAPSDFVHQFKAVVSLYSE